MIKATLQRKIVVQNLSKKTHEAIELALEKTTTDMAARAKILCPVDTSNLKNSITPDYSEIKSLHGSVFTPCPYALYVEHGTVKQAAQPFMTPAFIECGNSFAQAFLAILRARLR